MLPHIAVSSDRERNPETRLFQCLSRPSSSPEPYLPPPTDCTASHICAVEPDRDIRKASHIGEYAPESAATPGSRNRPFLRCYVRPNRGQRGCLRPSGFCRALPTHAQCHRGQSLRPYGVCIGSRQRGGWPGTLFSKPARLPRQRQRWRSSLSPYSKRPGG